MGSTPARRGSPLPPRPWGWWRARAWDKVRKGHWQKPDPFACRPGWDTDPHHYARAATKRRAIADQHD